VRRHSNDANFLGKLSLVTSALAKGGVFERLDPTAFERSQVTD